MNQLNAQTLHRCVNEAVRIAQDAGRVCMQYFQGEFKVIDKGKSWVTDVDLEVHNLIESRLTNLPDQWPFLSEESGQLPDYETRKNWQRYWLVDPIDSTNSFIKGTDEFTVNIALIENETPILGVIHQPATGKTYWGARSIGAYLFDSRTASQRPIFTKTFDGKCVHIIGSRSRGLEQRQEFAAELAKNSIDSKFYVASSSIKFCRVAEGAVDIYLAYGATSEWDTAAGQSIVECAGGKVRSMDDDKPLVYNKSSFINPWFLASGMNGELW